MEAIKHASNYAPLHNPPHLEEILAAQNGVWRFCPADNPCDEMMMIIEKKCRTTRRLESARSMYLQTMKNNVVVGMLSAVVRE
jgi:hypothetical protein